MPTSIFVNFTGLGLIMLTVLALVAVHWHLRKFLRLAK